MVVPPQYIYYLATGIYDTNPSNALSGKVVKKVGVLVRWFPKPVNAIETGPGCDVTFGANSTIYGSMRIGGNLNVKNLTVYKDAISDNGRVLVTGDVQPAVASGQVNVENGQVQKSRMISGDSQPYVLHV